MKRIAFAIIVIILLAVACVRPDAPVVDVVDVERNPADFQVRGLGTGGGCPVLDGSRGWSGGPWNDAHQFPRLYHLFATNTRGSFDTDTLDDIALFDVVELMADTPYFSENGGLYNMPAPTDNPIAYLRSVNSNVKVLPYVPAYYWWQSTATKFGDTYHPLKVEIEDAINDANGGGGNWWLENASGNPQAWFGSDGGLAINMTSLEPDLDGSGNNYTAWLSTYITSTDFLSKTYGGTAYWDGIRWDVADSTPHYYTEIRNGDADESGTSDLSEYGKPAINDYVVAGLNEVNAQISGAGFMIVGNGSWTPGNDGYNALSPYIDTMNGAMAENFPTLAGYYPYSGGEYANSAGANYAGESYTPGGTWAYAMRQYVTWMDYATDPLYIIMYQPLQDQAIFSPYVSNEYQARRFTLASALLDNGYATTRVNNSYATWCDECGVNGSGVATMSLAASGWLGCPLGVAVESQTGLSMRYYIDAGNWDWLSGYVWLREFENGLVVVNPTTRSQTINVGSGWKRIQGSTIYGDTSHNDGSSVTGGTLTIDPVDAYVLVRDTAGTATPGPTELPLSTRTATPTPPATATPGPSPTLGPQPTTASYTFRSQFETPPAAATPAAGTPVYDGEWPWRSDYASSYTLTQSTDAFEGAYSYQYDDFVIALGEVAVGNVWNIRPTKTPYYTGNLHVAIKSDPGAETLGRPFVPLGAYQWDNFLFDQGEQANNGPWNIVHCPSSASTWFYPSSACASAADACKIKFECHVCSATPTWTELYTDCDGATWAELEIAWDIETGQDSSLTVTLDETPVVTWTGTPVPTPGTNGWNGIYVGARDIFNNASQYSVKVDDLWFCDNFSCAAPTAAPGTPTATPVSPADGLRWITEVLADNSGSACVDWNLRAGCGENDEFIEVGSAVQLSMAGYRLAVGDCEYTFADDNLTSPLKVIFADEFTDTTTGAQCNGFDANGTAYLYDGDGLALDSRSYLSYVPGDSWQAAAWTNPGGVWVSRAPNPGMEAPTPTPTPTRTPTATPTPTVTPTP